MAIDHRSGRFCEQMDQELRERESVMRRPTKSSRLFESAGECNSIWAAGACRKRGAGLGPNYGVDFVERSFSAKRIALHQTGREDCRIQRCL